MTSKLPAFSWGSTIYRHILFKNNNGQVNSKKTEKKEMQIKGKLQFTAYCKWPNGLDGRKSNSTQKEMIELKQNIWTFFYKEYIFEKFLKICYKPKMFLSGKIFD